MRELERQGQVEWSVDCLIDLSKRMAVMPDLSTLETTH